MQPNGLIDLSEVRKKAEASKSNDATIEQLTECLAVYRATVAEAIDQRFTLMQAMPQAMASRVQLPPGQVPQAQELMQRLKFIDASIQRLSDLIGASLVILQIHNGKIDLSLFPSMQAYLQPAINVVVSNRDKTLAETTQDEALLVAGFRDLDRWTKLLA